ncbi:MAG: serine hydrolase [Ignavibacteria bacterium]|nr:serine hydrolase [Ignavibacteria bacterium]
MDSLSFVNDNGITSGVHEQNTGKVTFMSVPVPIEKYTEADFLSSFEISDTCDFNIRVFLKRSLTNELHTLAPSLTADVLTANGNYSFTFYVDGKKIYNENLNPGAGSVESKNTATVFRVPLISSTGEDSWGRFLWQRFWFGGGEDALSDGTHRLRIEISPYVKQTDVITGNIIAEGEIDITLKKPFVSAEQIEVQPIAPAEGWNVSNENYNKELIRELNRKILQNSFKQITGIVVIKNGNLLLEEYFNGAGRDSLHDTRSVGKSFASAIMGIAIADGYIKNEIQTLETFYDLSSYSNFSLAKNRVTLKSLLTMSSGFLGSDIDQSSPGNEENMYPTPDWVKFTLDLPMDSSKTMGKSWDYFTAGVVVIGDVLNKTVPGGLEEYAAKKLFKPLGITKYQWEYTPQGVANTAGGLRMRSLDYARFGQLYKDGGQYNGKQIILADWVKKSISPLLQVPVSETDYYGYLFWNSVFTVNGKKYQAAYSSGNGGNKIYIFKDVPIVVVITSTAYGMPYAHRQVNKIMEEYILPSVLD